MNIKLGALIESFMKGSLQTPDSMGAVIGCVASKVIQTPAKEFGTAVFITHSGVFVAASHGAEIIPSSVLPVFEFLPSVRSELSACPVTYRAKCAFSALAYVVDSLDASTLWESESKQLLNCLAVMACMLTTRKTSRPHGFELASSQWSATLRSAWAAVSCGDLPSSASTASAVFESAFYELSMINFDAPAAAGYWAYHIFRSEWVNIERIITLGSSLAVVALEDSAGDLLSTKMFDRFVRNSPRVVRRVCELCNLIDGVPDHVVDQVTLSMTEAEFDRFSRLTAEELKECPADYEVSEPQKVGTSVVVTLTATGEEFDLSAMDF